MWDPRVVNKPPFLNNVHNVDDQTLNQNHMHVDCGSASKRFFLKNSGPYQMQYSSNSI